MKRYVNFDLELSNYRKIDSTEYLHTRVLRSPAGGQRQHEATDVALPVQLRTAITRLENRELVLDGLIALGERLAAVMLPPAARSFYRHSLTRLGRQQGLRIRVLADTPEIAAIPWEYTYVGRPDTPDAEKGADGFLVLNRQISLVRYEVLDEPEASAGTNNSVRVAALLADVRDANFARLDLAQEEVNLRQALERVAGIEVSYLRPGRLEQLEELLSTDGAEIFHFAGHGEFATEMGEEPGTVTGRGRLIAAGDNGAPAPVDAENLALDLRSRGIRLAMLGACEAAQRDSVTPWSGVAPMLVRQGIPAVVGMQYTVRDGNAVAFSRRFYQALAHGHSIDTAVSEGRLGVLQRAGGTERDWGVPVLYLRTDRSVLFPKPVAPLLLNLTLLVGATLAFMFWFYLHWYPLVSYGAEKRAAQIGLTVGAAISFFAVAKIVLTWLLSKLPRRETSFVDKCLRHSRARWCIAFLLCLSVTLLATTSSVYLKLDDESAESIDVVLESSADSHWRTRRTLTVSRPDNLIAGRPGITLRPPDELTVRVAAPAEWSVGDNSRTIHPGPLQSIRLSVRDDFVKMELTVVRIVPRFDIVGLLAEPGGENPLRRYRLHVEIDGMPVTSIDDLRQGIVYFGGDAGQTQNKLSAEGEADRRVAVTRCDITGSEQVISDLLQAWAPEEPARRHMISTPILEPGQALSIWVTEISDGLPGRTIAKKTVSVAELQTDRINTICLSRLAEIS